LLALLRATLFSTKSRGLPAPEEAAADNQEDQGKERKMTTFKIRVFEEGGRWFFRWDNVAVPTACGVTKPLETKEEAESERQCFMEAEKKKRSWVAFA